MTPEERAHELQWLNGIELDGRQLAAVLAALRAAENDALERAAVMCDSEARKADNLEEERDFAAYLAGAVRDLKHKD